MPPAPFPCAVTAEPVVGRAGPADQPERYVAAHYLAYLSHRDAGRLDDATSQLTAAFSRIGEVPQDQAAAVLAEVALHQAFMFRDVATARALLRQAAPAPGISVHRIRALAAIAFAEGKLKAAASYCDRVLAAPDSADQPGVSVALKDWVRALREECAAGLSGPGEAGPMIPCRGLPSRP